MGTTSAGIEVEALQCRKSKMEMEMEQAKRAGFEVARLCRVQFDGRSRLHIKFERINRYPEPTGLAHWTGSTHGNLSD